MTVNGDYQTTTAEFKRVKVTNSISSNLSPNTFKKRHSCSMIIKSIGTFLLNENDGFKS